MITTYRGRHVSVFTYEGSYKNAAGTKVPIMSDDEVIFGSTDARCDRYFGPGERLPMTTQEKTDYLEIFGFSPSAPKMPRDIGKDNIIVAAEFYPDVVRSLDGKSFLPRLQYAPMFISVDTNSFAHIENVAP